MAAAKQAQMGRWRAGQRVQFHCLKGQSRGMRPSPNLLVPFKQISSAGALIMAVAWRLHRGVRERRSGLAMAPPY